MTKRRGAATGFERALALFWPGLATRRVRARYQFEAMTGGYKGARRDRRATKTWKPGGGSADADLLPNLAELRERSRDLARNAPLAAGALGAATTNVIGTGLHPQARIDRELLGLDEDAADQWERRADAEFRFWAESAECDITRGSTFYGLQSMAFRSRLESGDLFFAKRFLERPGDRFGLKLQAIEADRVSTPRGQVDDRLLPNGNTISGGVERDQDGAPVAYYIVDRHPGNLSGQPNVWQKVPVFASSGRRVILHLFKPTRPGQARGVPYLAPVMEALKELDQYTEAERSAAVVAALFTVFVKTETGEKLAPATPADETGGAADDPDYKLGRGAILELKKNQNIETANPGRPNDSFEKFVSAVMQQIASALEQPLEIILKQFQSSYSASRAALLEAWKFYRAERQWFAGPVFCQDIYDHVITEAVARGYLEAPGFLDDMLMRRAWLRADWIGPAPGQIDPVKEAVAAEKLIEMGVSTLAEQTAAITGGDWETKHRQRAKEKRMRIADGLEDAAPTPAPALAAPAGPALPPPDDDDDDDDDSGDGERPDGPPPREEMTHAART